MTNREIASAILLFLLFAIGMTNKDARNVFVDVIKGFRSWKIWMPISLYILFVVACVSFAHRTGLWNHDLLVETALWTFVSGIPILFSVRDAGRSSDFFRRRFLSIVQIGALFAFFANIENLGLLGEIILQSLLAVLVVLEVTARQGKEAESVSGCIQPLIFAVSVFLFMYTAISLYIDRRLIDWEQIVLSLGMSIWLPACSITFLFGFSLVAGYESAFARFTLFRDTERPGILDKIAVILALNVHLRAIHSFKPYWGKQVIEAETLLAKIKEAGKVKDQIQERDREDRLRIQLLEQLAGVQGTDQEGRRLDQREFAETRNALYWVETCQFGHYRNRNGTYKPDLMDILYDFSSYGLPADHGIHLVVSEDGQKWYAWRRTITGWVLAIGAAGPPPDRWLYDGSEPPSNYPNAEGSWDHWGPQQFALNWT